MLEQLTPFRLCSSQPTRRSAEHIYPRRCKFTPRHNPQPALVKHFNGIHNMRICHVKEQIHSNRFSEQIANENPALVRANTFTGLPMFRYRDIPYKERAVPRLGLLPIQEPWRRELHALTECVVAPVLEELGKAEDISRLVECHPYPICRPITSWKCSQIVNIRNKNVIFPSRDRVKTPKFKLVPQSKEDNLYFEEEMANDFESQVFALLGQVLQCREVEPIKFWLATANDRDKASMMSVLQMAFESKMKAQCDEEKNIELDWKRNEDPCPSFSVDEEVEDHDDVDRLRIYSRQSTRTELSRPKTCASKIRPQTSKSFKSIHSSNSEEKPNSSQIYLRYKTNLNSKSIQTEDIVHDEISNDELKIETD